MRSDRGNALASVLIMLAALTPLGAFAVMHARLDVLVQHHMKHASMAFAVAEAGLEHARAEVALDPSFDRLTNGPDRQPATNDDGEFPFVKTRLVPTHPDFQYELRISRQSAQRIEIVSTARGPGRSMHALALGVTRENALLPAAVTSIALRPTLDLGTQFRLDGTDLARRDPPQPGLVVDTNAAIGIREHLSSEVAARIDGAGGAPSVASTVAPDVAHLVAELGRKRSLGLGSAFDGAIGSGIAVSDGSLDIGSASGDGALVVNGNLRISGTFTFTGLIIVSGDILFEATSVVQVQGGLLQGRGNGVIALLGAGSVSYDSSAIGNLDATYPGLLPHRARISGWRDLS